MRVVLGEAGLLSDDTRSVAIFSELGKEYRVHNRQGRRLLRYRVDHQMISAGECCDFAMGVPNIRAVFLIELKGHNLRKAVSQIQATISYLAQKPEKYTIHARVVLGRVPRPDIRSSDVIALDRCLAKGNGTFKRGSGVMDEDV